jgi:hypothetical protein
VHEGTFLRSRRVEGESQREHFRRRAGRLEEEEEDDGSAMMAVTDAKCI